MAPRPNPFVAGLTDLGLVTPDSAPSAPADSLTPIVVEVIEEALRAGDVVRPIDVLLRLEIVTEEQCAAWRHGKLAYLERGITAGLNKVTRILRILEAEARTRGLTPVVGKYLRPGKGPHRRLRFSKRGDAAAEAAYARHYVRRP